MHIKKILDRALFGVAGKTGKNKPWFSAFKLSHTSLQLVQNGWVC